VSRDNITGRVYLERGRPVRVLVRWGGFKCRNILIEREDGSREVPPSRGLRKLPESGRGAARFLQHGSWGLADLGLSAQANLQNRGEHSVSCGQRSLDSRAA
jgi:hypothetical protein